MATPAAPKARLPYAEVRTIYALVLRHGWTAAKIHRTRFPYRSLPDIEAVVARAKRTQPLPD